MIPDRLTTALVGRNRLHREQQHPIADAVRISSEIAGALDSAHRRAGLAARVGATR